MLDQAVAEYVAKGWAVESRTDTRVVLIRKKPVGLFFNGLMTALTGGIWAGSVAYDLRHPKIERKVLAVDASGNLKARRSLSRG